jgi:hypothetical protein
MACTALASFIQERDMCMDGEGWTKIEASHQ